LPELFGRFHPTAIVTADSPDIAPGRGKPKPDIFFAAAHKLGIDVGTADACTPQQEETRARGLVFEDARLGVQAGVAAGMNGEEGNEERGKLTRLVVWVPDAELLALDPTATHGAKQVLEHLEEWDPAQWGLSPINFDTSSE
jgi:pseudouridine-5'-monophosphatase